MSRNNEVQVTENQRHSDEKYTSSRRLPREKIMPTLGLRVRAVLHLQPTVAVVLVNAQFPLRHNALKVTDANFREKALPVLLDVLSIKHA